MRFPIALPPADARQHDFVSIGENSLDVVVRGRPPRFDGSKHQVSSIRFLPGGQATTAAVAAARLGARVCYAGVVGDDEAGRRTREVLAAEGIDDRTVRTAARSRTAVLWVDEDSGERTVMESRDPLLDAGLAGLPETTGCSGRLLLVDGEAAPISARLAAAARRAGGVTIVDADRNSAGLSDLLSVIDILVLPQPFLTELTGSDTPGAALRVLADRYRPAVAVVTLGEDGALGLAAGKEIRTPGLKVDVVDTTGAGDTFRGTFAAAWSRFGPDADIEDVLSVANAAAALNCRGLGAQAGLPAWDEVTAFLTKAGRMRSN